MFTSKYGQGPEMFRVLCTVPNKIPKKKNILSNLKNKIAPKRLEEMKAVFNKPEKRSMRIFFLEEQCLHRVLLLLTLKLYSN